METWNIKDKDGRLYTTYQSLTDEMLEICENPEAHSVAAGFGNLKTQQLLEFAEHGFDDDTGTYDLEIGAESFDAWIASE